MVARWMMAPSLSETFGPYPTGTTAVALAEGCRTPTKRTPTRFAYFDVYMYKIHLEHGRTSFGFTTAMCALTPYNFLRGTYTHGCTIHVVVLYMCEQTCCSSVSLRWRQVYRVIMICIVNRAMSRKI